ncbi:MAG: SCO family protein [Bradyrhizobiaceae bacterium]|nr:MAG: SCO family protein [Bradyrhizobiaceae bacterium]
MNDKLYWAIAGLSALILAAFCVAAGLSFLFYPEPIAIEPQGITRLGTPAIGGPFTLVATDGQTVTDRTYRGKWLLIYFGYTSCPDACPTALNSMSVALEQLGSRADELQPLFVTIDPQRDSRDVVANYLTSFDSRIVGLTGSGDQIASMIKTYRLYVSREKPDSDGKDYSVSHSSFLYLMDPQGAFVSAIHSEATGDEIATRLRKEMAMARADR